MLKKRIIPCLDVKDGRVVKGINFVNLKDAGDPVEQAKIYDKGGADEICFLDITASSENRKILLDKVSETAKSCFVPLTVGGGISSIEDIKSLLLAGADKVSINTAAVKNHNFIKESSIRFGSQCIVIAIDAKKVGNNKWEIFTHGGRNSPGTDVIEYAKNVEKNGSGEIPTLDEVKLTASMMGILESSAIGFWEWHEINNAWRKNGTLIKWRLKLPKWASNDKEFKTNGKRIGNSQTVDRNQGTANAGKANQYANLGRLVSNQSV